MNKLTTILNKSKSWSINTKAYIFMSIVMLLLVIGFILLYRNYNNVINENKIQTVTKAKEVTQEDVKQWKDKIDDHNNEFIETQKDLTEKAKDIRKNTKPSKLPNYGKPIIKDASYNAMLDSLLVAQPN